MKLLVSEYELKQMGKRKRTYNYVSIDEYKILRPYLVQKSLARASKNKADLDPTMTAYTPGETLHLIRHPKVQEWSASMRDFKIPDKYEIVIFVPCAATKPWGFSCKGDFYPWYNKIRLQVQESKIRPIYFVTISEPLGVVPEDFWETFPQYDNPGLFKDTALQSGMMTSTWSKSPLGSKREMPFDDQACEKAIKILGKQISCFIKNNFNHRFISFVEHANPKSLSSHSRMLSEAEKIIGFTIQRNPKKPNIGRAKVNLSQYILQASFSVL